MSILKIIFLVCCVVATTEKIISGKGFNDYIWPINAALWCLTSI